MKQHQKDSFERNASAFLDATATVETIEGGDVIKAYHHEPCKGHPESYIIGRVIAMTSSIYVVRTRKDILGGKERPIGEFNETYNVPREVYGDWDGRITKVED